MEEKLLRLSFAIAILGILSLFFISQHLDYEQVDIDRIYDIEEEDKIKFIGTVDDLYSHENITFMTISQISRVDVIAFDNVSINVGDKIEMIGTVSEEDIIASRIRVFG